MPNVRIARRDEFESIASFYDEMVDDMKHSAFDPLWDRKTHPSDEFLRGALEKRPPYRMRVRRRAGRGARDGSPWRSRIRNGAVGCKGPRRRASVIHVLCTLPRFQGKGIARTLLRGALDIARANGQRCVRLDILPDNAPARSLYESEGFVRVCKTMLHYPDGSFDAILYECLLERS